MTDPVIKLAAYNRREYITPGGKKFATEAELIAYLEGMGDMAEISSHRALDTLKNNLNYSRCLDYNKGTMKDFTPPGEDTLA